MHRKLLCSRVGFVQFFYFVADVLDHRIARKFVGYEAVLELVYELLPRHTCDWPLSMCSAYQYSTSLPTSFLDDFDLEVVFEIR